MRSSWFLPAVLIVAAVLLPGARLDAQTPAAHVTISYTLTRLTKVASNQFAIWIEDEKGAFVRTLYVTGFTGTRAGWRIRKQTCATWVSVADVANLPQREIDAVSGATPWNGALSVVWDLTDRFGKPVPAGAYRYRIEANLFWENTVFWTGTIRIGGGRESSQAVATLSPAGAEAQGTVISGVSALYEPGS